MRNAPRPLLDYHQRLLREERGSVRQEPGGRLNAVLLYPNTYQVGAANLGLAVVYSLINQRPDALCERAFLPDRVSRPLYEKSGAPLLSLESSRPISEFDLILATVSFENDSPNLAAMLAQGKVGPGQGPLVVAGGVVPMLNPEPLAHMVDGFLLGEAEVVLERFLDALGERAGLPRRELLAELAREVPGFYAPGFFEAEYHPDGTLKSFEPFIDVPSRVLVPKYRGPASGLASSVFQAPSAQFGDMTLLEVGRGCGRGCRFCAAGHLFRPPRLGAVGDFLERAVSTATRGGKVGLVSAAVTDLNEVALLTQEVVAAGGRVSVSSLRADRVTPELAESLAASHHQTVALAPEAGSERLRRVINKGLSEDDLAGAVECLIAAGVPNLRLYFMVGLPGEEDEDIEELIALARRVRQQVVSLSRPRGRLGMVTLSVNPFVPKPFTPFQWEPMAGLKLLKSRMERIKRALKPLANMKVNFEVPKYAVLQAVISRGDRRLAGLISALAQGLKPERAYAAAQVSPEFYAQRRREQGELLPWDFLDHGLKPGYLWREAQRGMEAKPSPSCDPEHCRRCGICGDDDMAVAKAPDR
jgi:radical SAM superfamily enzyme YgiQ (UPF0313 family)